MICPSICKVRENIDYKEYSTYHSFTIHITERNLAKRPKFIKQTVDQKIESLIEELGISQPKIVDITSSQRKYT